MPFFCRHVRSAAPRGPNRAPAPLAAFAVVLAFDELFDDDPPPHAASSRPASSTKSALAAATLSRLLVI
jgi:hypothetical protein